VKNDLSQREDVKGISQCPIWSRFDIRRPATALGNDIQTERELGLHLVPK
jgi:hypothetical protein